MMSWSGGKWEYKHEGLNLIYQDNSLLGLFLEESVPAKLVGGPPAQIHMSGGNRALGHGVRSIGCTPGDRLQVVGWTVQSAVPSVNGGGSGDLVTLTLKDVGGNSGLVAQIHYHFMTDLPVVRTWIEVANEGSQSVGLEWVYSALLPNIASGGQLGWWEKTEIHVPHNSWFGEGQWQSYHPRQLGLTRCNPDYIESSAAQVTSQGSMSTQKALPMGMLEDLEQGLTWFWQIEHSGTWSWEIAEGWGKHLYLLMGGPTEPNSGWWHSLEPGKSFTTIPVAFGLVQGGFEEAVTAITRYRRKCLVPQHTVDDKLPVIFNDYMNCLMADPTMEKELPLIDAASRGGAEYFVIDAGWYAPIRESWWDSVGAWEPNPDRFPQGFGALMQAIKDKGMTPGVWLEIEVAGINGPLATKPDSWFLMRHGHRTIDNGRYFLDFRNKEVQDYCTEVVRRLVEEYGVGYIKNDYNVNAGLGTDVGVDSAAQGLLEHMRAFHSWLDQILAKFPRLILESCSGGGNRMDYALMSRARLQSSSDQMDYRIYPSVLSGAVAGIVPEQLAVWSYPMKSGDCEEVVANMVNSMLMRIHLSGHLADLDDDRFSLVAQGIDVYKSIRSDICKGLPFWPLGLLPSDIKDCWHSLGMRIDGECKTYVAVWRLGSGIDKYLIPLDIVRGKGAKVELIYPETIPTTFQWNDASGQLSIHLPHPYSARLFSVSW